MKRSKEGVAGFFLDIPALLAILIAFSIFTVSIFHAQQNFSERSEIGSKEEKIRDFIRRIRTSALTKSEGRFEADKIANLNLSLLQDIFPPDSLNFHYNLSIEDNSQYADSYSCSFQTSKRPRTDNIYSARSPITIEERTGVSHLASLKVMIWGVGP
ncbi:MAG: hypothetical protein ACQESD_06180 [Thermoplasmatota archaeon]